MSVCINLNVSSNREDPRCPSVNPNQMRAHPKVEWICYSSETTVKTVLGERGSGAKEKAVGK